MGSNDGYGVDATFSLLPERPHRHVPGRARAARARPATTLSYRGFFDYNADRYGVQAERLEVRAQLPSRDRLRAPDRLPAQLRAAALQPAAQGRAARAEADDAGQPQLHDQHGRPARHARAGRPVPVGVHQQRRGQRHLHRQLRAARAARSPLRRASASRSAATTSTRCSSPTPAASSARTSGALVYETGTFYDGNRQSIALNTARMQVTPQVSLEPSFSVNWVDLVEGIVHGHGAARARHLHGDAAHVRERHRPVQLHRHLRRAATCASGGNTAPAASCSSSTPTTTTPTRRAMADTLRNRAFVVKVNRLFRP